ncbi:MAG TPA: PEP-CTERM sorting domain-containing protein [Pirellulales bacterium]|nr:PEP-CTERM sorting domain-containing protein [Pirellulales bacterium]
MDGNNPLRYLAPMTMAEVLKPQLRDEAERLAAARRRSKVIKRFFAWIGFAVILSSSGGSIATIVAPSLLKHLGVSPARGDNSDDAGYSGDGGGAFDVGDQAPSRRKADANTYSYSSSSSSAASESSGGSGATPEPSSIVLLALGGLALGAITIRKRRK